MAVDAGKMKAQIEQMLRKNKALTEKEVKEALAKSFRTSVEKIGAGPIRSVRKALGIDRPGAIAHAKAMLGKDSALEAKKVIDTIMEKFGIRLGPPDVSRLRPRKAKTGRAITKARAAKAAKAAKAEKAAKPAVVVVESAPVEPAPVESAPAPAVVDAPAVPAPARRRGRPAGRPGRRPGRPARRAPAAAPSPATAPTVVTTAELVPAEAVSESASAPMVSVEPTPSRGIISLHFEGKGAPEDLAAFFRSLAERAGRI